MKRLGFTRVNPAQFRTVERILRTWDPIGVQPGAVALADKYDGYAPYIVWLIQSGCTSEQLTTHLNYLRTEKIGAPENHGRDMEVASQLIQEFPLLD